jgi:ribosome maturation factor RimP
MNTNPQKSEFHALNSQAESIAQSLGLLLYDLEFKNGPQGPVLRIYIDRDQGGISVDDCADFSRGINDYLEAHDPFPQSAYSLEVSSPGVDRPLSKKWHFEKVIGKKINIKTEKALSAFGCEDERYLNSKSITDELLAVSEETILVRLGEAKIEIPIAAIEKAKVAFAFNDNEDNKINPKNKNKNKNKNKTK